MGSCYKFWFVILSVGKKTDKPQVSSTPALWATRVSNAPQLAWRQRGALSLWEYVNHCCHVHLLCVCVIFTPLVCSPPRNWPTITELSGRAGLWTQVCLMSGSLLHPVNHIVWKLNIRVVEIVFYLKGWFKNNLGFIPMFTADIYS